MKRRERGERRIERDVPLGNGKGESGKGRCLSASNFASKERVSLSIFSEMCKSLTYKLVKTHQQLYFFLITSIVATSRLLRPMFSTTAPFAATMASGWSTTAPLTYQPQLPRQAFTPSFHPSFHAPTLPMGCPSLPTRRRGRAASPSASFLRRTSTM